MKRHILRLIAAACLMAAVLCLTCAMASPSGTLRVSGSAGGSVTWAIYEEPGEVFTLYISGTGAMTKRVGQELDSGYDMDDYYEYAYQVERIVVENGVTRVCNSACGSMGAPSRIELPASCVSVGRSAFAGSRLTSVTLPEGLKYIEAYAFNARGDATDGFEPMCTVTIPRSVLEIGAHALDYIFPAVYPGTEGENYCLENGLKDYVLLGSAGPDAGQTAKMALLDTVMQVEDVPMRYRAPAISALNALNLTASQANSLKEYVISEEKALKVAMLDNNMSIVEITGFMTRFVSAVNGAGIQAQYEIKLVNGFPGVSATVTAGGQATTIEVYRTGRRWVVENLPVSQEGYFTWVDVEGGVMVTGYTGTETYVSIPAYLGGKRVVSIGDGRYDSGIQSLTIPEGVKRIEANACSNLPDLEDLYLPDSLEVIEDYAFDYNSLTEVSFGSHLRVLGYAFSESMIHSVYLPASLEELRITFPEIQVDPANTHFASYGGGLYNQDTKTLIHFSLSGGSHCDVRPGTLHIGNGVFADMDFLTGITLPAGLETIGFRAFYHCYNLTLPALPDSVKSVGYNALEGVPVYTFHIPSALFTDNEDYAYQYQSDPMWLLEGMGLEVSDVHAFSVGAGNPYFSARDGVLFSADGSVLFYFPGSAAMVVEVYYVPSGVTTIASEAFCDAAVKNVVLPEGLTTLKSNAFEGCGTLQSVTLPSTLTVLDGWCFADTGIVSLTIPESISVLTSQGWLGSLTTLTLPPTVTTWDGFWKHNVNAEILTIRGVAGSRAQDLAAEIGCGFEAIGGLGQAVTIETHDLYVALGDWATVSGTVTGGSDGLIRWRETTLSPVCRLEFPSLYGSKLMYGGSVTFRGTMLGDSTLVADLGYDGGIQDTCAVHVVKPSALPYSQGVLRMPAGTTEIGSAAFSGSGCRIAVIPATVHTISNRAFANCPNLKVVEIPDSVTYIASNAFDGCDGLAFVCGANGYARQYADEHDIETFTH